MTIPNVFAPNTIIRSGLANANFSTVQNVYNTHDIAIVGVHGIGAATAIAALNIDWSLNTIFTRTLSGSVTFTFSNNTDGQMIFVLVTAGLGETVTWPTVLWPGGVVPTQTAGGTDLYSFVQIAGTIYGSQATAFA